MSDQTVPADDGAPPRPAGSDGTRDDEFRYDDPGDQVRGPGLALLVVGCVGLLVSFGLVGLGLMIVEEAANRRTRRPSDDAVAGVILTGAGLLLVPVSVLIAWGGGRMRQCRSRGLALTAALLACSSFLLLGLCAVFVMPFGIWALAVLLQPDVRREFARAVRDRRRSVPADAGDSP